VEIDPAVQRNGEQARGNNLAVGDDDDGIGICLAEELLGVGRTNFFRLEDGKVGGESGLFYG